VLRTSHLSPLNRSSYTNSFDHAEQWGCKEWIRDSIQGKVRHQNRFLVEIQVVTVLVERFVVDSNQTLDRQAS